MSDKKEPIIVWAKYNRPNARWHRVDLEKWLKKSHKETSIPVWIDKLNVKKQNSSANTQ